ncbi:hypothetical protein MT418_008170, partial [Batrachochytrium dendrobatidis]
YRARAYKKNLINQPEGQVVTPSGLRTEPRLVMSKMSCRWIPKRGGEVYDEPPSI